MNLREAVLSIVNDADGPLSSGEIADIVIERYPHLHQTEARMRSPELGRHSSARNALSAAVNDFVGRDPRFDKDMSVRPFRVTLRAAGGSWNDDELAASVESYLEKVCRLLTVKHREGPEPSLRWR